MRAALFVSLMAATSITVVAGAQQSTTDGPYAVLKRAKVGGEGGAAGEGDAAVTA